MDKRQERAARRRAETAAKRIEVIRELAGIVRPTVRDHAVAAEKLGIGVEQTRKLLAAWRLHGRSAMAPAVERRGAGHIEAAIRAAHEPLDLSDVPADRRDEAARRIDVIRRYLEAGRPDGAVADDFASQYGARRGSFLAAVRSWLLRPEPASLPTGSLPQAGADRRRLPDRVHAILEETVTSLGPLCPVADLAREAGERCVREGLPAPSWLTIEQARRKAIGRRAPSTGPDTAICLDQVLVRWGPTHTPPVAIVLLLGRPSARVLGHTLTAGLPTTSDVARTLAAHLRSTAVSRDPLTLEMALPAGDEWTRLGEVLRAGGVRLWSPPGRGLRSGFFSLREIGDRLGGLSLHRIRASSASLGFAEAPTERTGLIVRAAVLRHNEGRSGPAAGLTTADPSSLASELERLA